LRIIGQIYAVNRGEGITSLHYALFVVKLNYEIWPHKVTRSIVWCESIWTSWNV